MAEELIFTSTDKAERYRQLLPQIQALIAGEENLIANLANVSAALKMTFDFLWVGFYLVENDHLIVGPFQGSIACTKLFKGKGVCGTCWEQKQTILVPNVEEFPGHIYCNSTAKSEIVVPLLKNQEVVAVLDIDSDQLNAFDNFDAEYLEKIATCVSGCF